MHEQEPRFALEPERFIVEAVHSVEPDLAVEVTETVLLSTVKRRPQRRELAEALHADPDLLTSGRPEGPRSVERLIRALREHGAVHVDLPRCAQCQRQRPLEALSDNGRICRSCNARRYALANPCTVCGRHEFAARDRQGRPRCTRHPDGPKDPLASLCEKLACLPVDLPQQKIKEAVLSVERRSNGQRHLLHALEDVPNLLTGDGAQGPRKTAGLIRALLDRGATGLVIPACPFCRRARELSATRDGLRSCVTCSRASRTAICVRCQRPRFVDTRTFDGQPLCGSCRQAVPFNRKKCSRCGAWKKNVTTTGEGDLCVHCAKWPMATCADCGRPGPCREIRTGALKCTTCYERTKRQGICARCGVERAINYLTESGESLCKYCGEPRTPCSACGKTYRVMGRPDGKPLCQTCWSKHPAAHRPCTGCGTVERLFHHGLCTACAARRSLREVLTGSRTAMRPELEPVFEAILRAQPRAVLRWINKVPARRAILEALAEGAGPVTHETLDRCSSVQTATNLRAIFVAGGALPARDEQLVTLEKFLAKTLARVEVADERKILRSWATWHHLRRLRSLPDGKHVTHGQAAGVKHEIRNIVRLLDWLHSHGSGLADCTQDHLDTWLAEGPAQRAYVRAFLLWTSRRGHTAPLEVPLYSGDFTTHVIAQDQRWALVRRLVHDDQLDTVDRAAGLLLLLFAQPPSRITQLTTDQVTDHGDKVTLALGPAPADLPAPLDDLIRQLVQRRQGHAVTIPITEPKWLFPGGYPGQPLAPHHLGNRLRAIGIRPRVARNTALMDIASELPSFVFSRLLGFHQTTGDNWNRERQGFGADYAADLSRR
ncbi:hypothetical protein [Streptacidiphilus sp. EB129]|uniref:hypothetical protein n=1 Tax=Streptacidiphilus sp. EB129 TaxID=3156262 RepID=UPI003514C8EB